ncbi:LOW QUALITY PROTEIN: coiled-coil domain-containing protein 180 [Sphaeramia orbicularis]|uniref:LOW QUALITY PROTEIN: coiled-coil domain-containing protein 180 n=1 Tax=Sphaeramia orbicularis TaxID=375764 RepID=UPI00118034DA|nr:LOW QUALITY PROTEIN: coiled-coil domain-containing protein 180 [Sphaeramia orbicularis]
MSICVWRLSSSIFLFVRALCSSSSSEQQVDDDDADDSSRLPDTACECQLRTACMDLLSSMQESDIRLDNLKARMEQVETSEYAGAGCQWGEVEQEVKLRKSRILELNHKLSTCETQRSLQIRAVLRKYCHLLEKISFLLPSDIYRLIHREATMINQSLLANRRSSARLLLCLLEENLQKEAGLRLHWDDCVNHCRRSRVHHIIEDFRKQCRGHVERRLTSEQQTVQEAIRTWRDCSRERCDIISNMCSLVPPTCSTDLVSDWFNQLTAVNQQIGGLHTDFLQQLRCCYEQTWQDHLAEMQRCEVALSAQQLSQDKVTDIVNAQLRPLIGQSQSNDEEQLAALDVYSDSLARHAFTLSRSVFAVMHAAVLLWETYSSRVKSTEDVVQQRLDDLRKSQEQHIQKKKVHLDNLLSGLRQESSEDALKTTLDKNYPYGVLDHLPSLFLEELLAYSSSLSTFFHLSNTYTPVTTATTPLPYLCWNSHEMQQFYPPSTSTEIILKAEMKKPEEKQHPVRGQDDPYLAQTSGKWLTEDDSSLLDLCDISYSVTFASSRGVVYSGPAFRCPAPDPPAHLQQTTLLTGFPVELLAQTLSRMRTLFMDHVEQHFQDLLSSAGAMVTARKEEVLLVQEIQLQRLDPQFVQTHIYQPRKVGHTQYAELQLHLQSVDLHCQQMSDVLASCRMELKELQDSISRKNQQFCVTVSDMEDSLSTVNNSRRLETLHSTLQERVDHHIKDTQCCQTAFRQTVQLRLEEVKHTTTQLLSSFRLFSEGGDFAPQELKMFQRRLKQETHQLSLTEESIYTQLETFESKSLQQVKEVSGRLEEKFSFLKSEFTFVEKIQKILNSTQIQIKAEAAGSNQQQAVISSKMCELRKMTDNRHETQVYPDQVCSFLSSVGEVLRERRQYLDYSLGSEQRPLQGDLPLSAHSKARKQVRPALPPALLQPSRTGVDFHDDPVVDVVKSLNRLCVSQDDPAEKEQRGRASAGKSTTQYLHRRSVSGQRGGRSSRTDRKVQIFGPRPVAEQKTHSFSSTVNAVLWKAYDVLLLVAEDFYRTERCITRFSLVPNTVDQWAESMQQRLLGYQEQAKSFLSTSKEELSNQLSVFEELLHSLPAILINNHEKQQEAELKEEVGGIMQKLEETMAGSEKEKRLIVNKLRPSLSLEDLQSLGSREELRQQQLHSAICSSQQALQDCVRRKGDEFITSLASLAEKLLDQLDHMTPEEIQAPSQQHTDDTFVTMTTEATIEQRPHTDIRTWSGISYLSTPTNDPNAPLTSVTMATTPSITTTKCTLAHVAVVKERDATVKRFEQLFRSELSRSEDNKQRQLSELQSWSEHWRQQLHTLTQGQYNWVDVWDKLQ